MLCKKDECHDEDECFLYWRFETLKILNAAIFNKYFTCKIYIDVLKERFTHEKIVHV